MAAPTRAKRKLGIFLAEMRDQSGLTATEAAKELLTNQSNISRYEVGGVMPLWATVAMLMSLYGASEEEHATAKKLWEQAHDEPRPVRLPAGTPKSFRKLIAAEAEADSERIVEPTLVSGLLQTEAYARALMSAGHRFSTSGTHTESVVNARLHRQDRLVEPDPLRLHVIMDQMVIVREIGGAKVMREQLAHLLELGKRPNITLQVVPFGTGAYGTMNGSYMIVGYPDDEPPNIYLEYPAGGDWLEDGDDVRKFVEAFEDAAKLALSPSDTAKLIRQQIGALGKQ